VVRNHSGIVDLAAGSMYKAANFTLIGQSSGNYRPDSISLPKDAQVKKDYLVYCN